MTLTNPSDTHIKTCSVKPALGAVTLLEDKNCLKKDMYGSGSKCQIKKPLHTQVCFFFYCYGEMFLCLVHTRASIVSYLCFQLEHVALALHGVMLHTPVWEKNKILTGRLQFVKLRNKAAVTVISRRLDAGLLSPFHC